MHDADAPLRTSFWYLGALLLVLMLAAASFWREPRAAGLAFNTLELVAGMIAIALPVGTLLAALLSRTNLPGRGVFVAAWALLLFLPLYVQASAWDAGFGQQGWFTLMAGQVTDSWLRGLRAAVWIHGLAAIPWVVLIVGLGLRQVDAELEEVGLLDASPWRVFWTVTLPSARPAVIAATLFVVVATAGEMTVTDIYRVRTYAEELYTNAAFTADAVELGISVWPHIAIIAVLTALAWQAAIWLAPRSDRSAPRRLWVVEMGAARWPAFFMVLVLTLLALGVPVGNLVYKAGFMIDIANGSQPTWSWDRFEESTLPQTLNPLAWRFAREYAATLQLGACVATASTILGLLLASLARDGGWRALPAVSAAMIGLALPGPLVALGVIWLLNRPTPAILPWLYDETPLAPTMAIALRTLPLTTLVMWGALRSIDRDQLDIARADGAGPLALLGRVLLPQRWPAVAICWLASFAIAAGDLTSSLLVIQPGQTTIANQVFLLVHAGVHNAEAGLCLGQLAFFAAITAAVLSLAWRQTTLE